MANIILQMRDLSKSYAHDGVQNHVLNHIDLDVYETEFTVIMGPSGSGKSTLLYCLSGMEKVSGGTVSYKGKEIQSLTEKQLAVLRRDDFGFIFQQIHLVSNLSLFENAAIPAYLKGDRSNREVNAQVEALLKRVHVTEAATRLPSQASGGEQQRAAIARALINRPGILFADEATGALNRSNTDAVLDLLTDFHVEGQSIVMVTHDARAALRGDRILYLLDGRIVGELRLPPYATDKSRDRETQVNTWLQSLAW
jgi:putative ABC transport system ATP-binding protein